MPESIVAVGLLILTKINGQVFAVLQKRGLYKFVDGKVMQESWRGACQLTVHGKLENEESVFAGLIRECTEEIGGSLSNLISSKLHKLQPINTIAGRQGQIENFAIFLNPGWLARICLAPSSGGIVLLSKQQTEALINLSRHYSKTCIVPHNVTAMFADDIETIKKALELNPA